MGVELPELTDSISCRPGMLGENQVTHPYLYWEFKEMQAVRTDASAVAVANLREMRVVVQT